MKRFALTLLLLGSLLGLSSALHAQDYKTAIGLRLGAPTAVSLKRYLSPSNAFELSVGGRNFLGFQLFSISPAFLHHIPLKVEDPILSDIKWYVGAGGSLLFVNTVAGFSTNAFFSVDAYVGLEYTFENLPISLSLDWIPRFYLGDDAFARFGVGSGALGIRYTLQ